ncbi:cobalamin-5'-phosphate synthase [Arcicella aurantiaca]|uniref:Adenosylcobinamide-GDP ribazoletransferase n=1 Tax=Arcicella aurantiaca TaxID=591202 RepID=A0A316E1E8_9BACT|nr:adenosylcobinamide-GDP ribazoletransferase [Arcicella aurantiaca]PWK16640.1 cobalamin-5'-phosphate synthase [Arcicella aurantiaca]
MNFKKILSTINQWAFFQCEIFLNAIKHYTRIPIPKWVILTDKVGRKVNIFLPIIGWIIGGVSAVTFYVSTHIFNTEIAILLSIVVAALTTGLIHENGLAHTCDALGEGKTERNMIEIMKDFRLGTFGTMGLILLLVIKFFSLEILDNQTFIWTIFIAHSLSRFVPISLNFTLNYIEEDAPKNYLTNIKIHQNDLLTAYIFAIFPLFLYAITTKNFFLFLVFPPLILLHLYFGYYFKKKFGGYTNECFGATQQIAEVIIYLVIVAIST